MIWTKQQYIRYEKSLYIIGVLGTYNSVHHSLYKSINDLYGG